MRKHLPAILVLCLASTAITAQQFPAEIKIKCTEPVNVPVLVIVDGFETDLQHLAINTSNIEKIEVVKENKPTGCDAPKANGIIVITTRTGTEFYKFSDFVNPEKNINMSVTRVQLDELLLSDMKKMLVDKSIFKQTMISASKKLNEQDCTLTSNDTLVITTTLKEHKE